MDEKYFTCPKCHTVFAAWAKKKKDTNQKEYFESVCPYCNYAPVLLFEKKEERTNK